MTIPSTTAAACLRRRRAGLGSAALGAVVPLARLAPMRVHVQATARVCSGDAGEKPARRVLAAHADVGAQTAGALYWRICTFADAKAAERVWPPHGAVVPASGRVWLFDPGERGLEISGGHHRADIGPLPLDATHAGARYSVGFWSPRSRRA